MLKSTGEALIAPHFATRVMKARRPGTCPECGGPIQVGQRIALAGRWQHIRHIIDRQHADHDGKAA